MVIIDLSPVALSRKNKLNFNFVNYIIILLFPILIVIHCYHGNNFLLAINYKLNVIMYLKQVIIISLWYANKIITFLVATHK